MCGVVLHKLFILFCFQHLNAPRIGHYLSICFLSFRCSDLHAMGIATFHPSVGSLAMPFRLHSLATICTCISSHNDVWLPHINTTFVLPCKGSSVYKMIARQAANSDAGISGNDDIVLNFSVFD
ncbi:hypothetical protein U9M48_035809 [Paspalum notatum var. saurae]|uniref:Secreted protein n=1 Tax=Paspalum notatum var. saurae TaxID=547442 RepID=A0AAQ3UHS1_PASNO